MLDVLRLPRDLFRARNPKAPGFTWDPIENPGLIPSGHKARERLDYVLASRELAAAATTCVVFREVGTSDHAPVVVEFS